VTIKLLLVTESKTNIYHTTKQGPGNVQTFLISLYLSKR